MKKFIIAFLLLGMCTTAVKAQEITVFPSVFGESYYQDKEKIGWKKVCMLLEENTASQPYWKKSKGQMVGALIAGAANAGSAVWYLTSDDKDKSTTGPIITFAGTAIIGSIFYWSANKNKKQAILEFNDSEGKKTSYRLVPTSNQNGVGLALKF
ncbi:MAG: hypothetical protein AB8B59_16845 [Maribacter sp.]